MSKPTQEQLQDRETVRDSFLKLIKSEQKEAEKARDKSETPEEWAYYDGAFKELIDLESQVKRTALWAECDDDEPNQIETEARQKRFKEDESN